MPDTSSIKISTELKYRLNSLKVHPRETYNDLIGRLVSHASCITMHTACLQLPRICVKVL
ncbi:MAG: hypothetical protein CVV31_11205 [Methanomicrobiales archaeon HGW-Methanomicrobiales-2]|nr:MAG: hypothetical protein CVV31_11205 [Methanomicrobiales archaeon HGW-Methanomicrobiales-2]